MQDGEFYQEYCRRLGFFDVAVHENDVYFANTFYPALIRYSMSRQIFEYICPLPIFQQNGYVQYGPIAYADGKLVIGGWAADRVVVYDCVQQTVTKEIFIDHAYLPGDLSVANFDNIVVDQGCAYLLPGRAMAIMKIDLATYEVTYLTNWFREVGGAYDMGLVHFLNVAVVDDGTVLLPAWQKDKLIVYHLRTQTYGVRKLPRSDMYLSCAEPYGDDLLLGLREETDLYVMKPDGSMKCFSPRADVEDFEAVRGYKKIYVDQRRAKAYLFPIDANMVLCFDLRTHHFSKWKSLKRRAEWPFAKLYWIGRNNLLPSHVSPEGLAFVYNVYDGMTDILDLENGTCQSLPTVLAEEQVPAVAERERNRYFSKPTLENENVGLPDFLGFASSRSASGRGEASSADQPCGERIQETMMK